MSAQTGQELRADLKDPLLFGNEAGEDENPSILDSYFFESPYLSQFSDARRRLQIVRARKGIGKSALLNRTAFRQEQRPEKPIVIRTTGADLAELPRPVSGTHDVWLAYWQQAIAVKVALALGSEIKVALSDHRMQLVELAENRGLKPRGLISAIADRLQLGGFGKKPVETNALALLRSLSEESFSREVWIFIDDIDAKFTNTVDERTRIGSFFSALRAVVREFPTLLVRASVRTDVWWSLRDMEDLDKSQQYLLDLHWSNRNLSEILDLRIKSYFLRGAAAGNFPKSVVQSMTIEQMSQCVFKGRFSWHGVQVPVDRVLQVLSARRPRWMCQICHQMSNVAVKKRHERIESLDLNPALEPYSKNRLSDLYKEHGHQFDDLQNLIAVFQNGCRQFTLDDLVEHVGDKYMRVAASRMPKLDDARVSNPNELVQFLYRIGFVQAQKGETLFIDFEDQPDLLESETGAKREYRWVIHPIYRNTLGIR